MSNSITIATENRNAATNVDADGNFNPAWPTAASYALDYVNGGKHDWHLPSTDELKELFLDRNFVNGRPLLDRGYGNGLDNFYWSSSASDAPHDAERSVWGHWLTSSGWNTPAKVCSKDGAVRAVRPIRAF